MNYETTQAERRAELVRAMPRREGVLFLKGKNYEKFVQIFSVPKKKNVDNSSIDSY